MVGRFLFTLAASMLALSASGQIINKDKTNLANFVERLYRNGAFSGVKVVDDYDSRYLLSVVVLDPEKYINNGGEITMNKIASVRAMSLAGRFFNGSTINSETVIRTTDRADGNTEAEITEKNYEYSVGYVKSLELLSCFTDDNAKRVFVYFKTLDEDNKQMGNE